MYGLITDNYSCCGYRRKYYLIISGILGVICYLALGLTTDMGFASLLMLLNENFGALSDVITDGVMIIESRKNKEKGSSSLQAFQ